MTIVRDILTAPAVPPEKGGLITYINDKLTADFNRIQVHGWGFLGVRDGAGIRYRVVLNEASENDVDIEKTMVITIAKLITVNDELESQILGAELELALDLEIRHWSKCSPLVKYVDKTISSFRTQQNKNRSSGDSGAWKLIVQIEFELKFDAPAGI